MGLNGLLEHDLARRKQVLEVGSGKQRDSLCDCLCELGRASALARAGSSRIGLSDLSPGTRVLHKVFGVGKIERWIDSRVVRVIFDSGDSRMLVEDIAGLVPADTANADLGSSPFGGPRLNDGDVPF